MCDVDCDDADPGRFPGQLPRSADDTIDNDCDALTPDLFDADNDGATCDARLRRRRSGPLPIGNPEVG